jgi:hypothetical protein
LRHPDAEGADTRPEEVERLHRDREAAVGVAQHLDGLHSDAVEVEPADGMRRDQFERLPREAVAVARDGERGDPLRAVVGGAGEDAVDVSLRRVGDPGLRPGQPVAVTVRLGAQRERRDV